MLVLSWVQILVKQRCMLVFLHILFHICFSLFNSLFHLKAFSLLKFFSRNDILLYINRKDDIQMQIAEVKYSTLTRGKLFLVFWLILLNKLKLQKKGEEISQRINIRKFRTLAHWSRGQAGQRPERMVTILVLCCQPEPNGRSQKEEEHSFQQRCPIRFGNIHNRNVVIILCPSRLIHIYLLFHFSNFLTE